MYVYIMVRTQIYLTRREVEALDRAAKATGRLRSHLIREAIEVRFVLRRETSDVERALRETAGRWRRRREDGAAFVERLRRGRLAALHDRSS